jgi:hypothetical protein
LEITSVIGKEHAAFIDAGGEVTLTCPAAGANPMIGRTSCGNLGNPVRSIFEVQRARYLENTRDRVIFAQSQPHRESR